MRFMCRRCGDFVILLLAVFIGVFFVLNEKFDLMLGPVWIFSVSIFLGVAFWIFRGRFDLLDYILVGVIVFDGFFHLISPLENLVENSPDWAIAFNLFGGNGMPVIVHRLMGIFLILTSVIYVGNLVFGKRNWYLWVYRYLISFVTLVIISISYLLKLF